MGLWALGRQGDHSRSSNNKISSIIGKELGMTKQQKAKVLEERAKMQDISSNVNEVSWYLIIACTIFAPSCDD